MNEISYIVSIANKKNFFKKAKKYVYSEKISAIIKAEADTTGRNRRTMIQGGQEGQ